MNKKISFLYLSRYGQFTKSENLKNLKVTAKNEPIISLNHPEIIVIKLR